MFVDSMTHGRRRKKKFPGTTCKASRPTDSSTQLDGATSSFERLIGLALPIRPEFWVLGSVVFLSLSLAGRADQPGPHGRCWEAVYGPYCHDRVAVRFLDRALVQGDYRMSMTWGNHNS